MSNTKMTGEETNPEESSRNVREMMMTPGWAVLASGLQAQRDDLVRERENIDVTSGTSRVGEEYIRLTAEITRIDLVMELAKDLATDRE